MIVDQASSTQQTQHLKGILKQSSLLSEIQHSTQEVAENRKRVTFATDTFHSESLRE